MWNEYINFFQDINTVLGASSYLFGKALDGSLRLIASAYRDHKGNFDDNYCNLQLKVLDKCLPSGISSDNTKKFKLFFKNYIKENNTVILDEEGLRTFLSDNQILSADGIEDLIAEYRKKLIFQISNIQELYNHLTLTMLFEITNFIKEENNKDKDEYNKLLNTIQNQLTYFCSHDYYQGINSLQPSIFNYIMTQLQDDNCKPEIIDIAYKLTILMDYFKDKDELIPLARRILELIQNDKESYMYYRKKIGCGYSILQADRSNKDILDEVESLYLNLYSGMCNWCKNFPKEGYILKGLYESNYGALLLNRFRLLEGEAAEKCLDDALAHHLEGRDNKRKLCEYCENHHLEKNSEEYIDAKLKYLKSESNIGSCYYQKKDYRKALKYHQVALEGRICLGMDTEVIQTKEYILGCYLKIKNSSSEGLTEEEQAICKKYLKDCEEYYKKNNDTEKVNEIQKMHNEIIGDAS